MSKSYKRWKIARAVQRNRTVIFATVALVAMGVLSYTVYMTHRRETVDITTYRPLLEIIAEAESNGNYNAYFGNAQNDEVQFTGMKISEVLAWQDEFVAGGSASSAVGRYQVLNTTLRSLVQQGVVQPEQYFNQQTQDRIAVALLDRRGGEQYVNEELSAQEFAANLAKEWASLPKMVGNSPEQSYYQSALNSAHVSKNAVMQAVNAVRAEED